MQRELPWFISIKPFLSVGIASGILCTNPYGRNKQSRKIYEDEGAQSDHFPPQRDGRILLRGSKTGHIIHLFFFLIFMSNESLQSFSLLEWRYMSKGTFFFSFCLATIFTHHLFKEMAFFSFNFIAVIPHWKHGIWVQTLSTPKRKKRVSTSPCDCPLEKPNLKSDN